MVKHAKEVIVIILLIALAAKAVWWVIEPALPALLVGGLMIILYTAIFRRKW